MTSSPPSNPSGPKTKAGAADAKQHVEARRARLEVGFPKPKAGGIKIDSPHSDGPAWQDTLLDAFGTTSRAFAAWLYTQEAIAGRKAMRKLIRCMRKTRALSP
jgi:hypothetical protein